MKLGGVPHPSGNGNGNGWFRRKGATPTPAHLLTTTVSLRLGHTLHRHLLHCRISLLHTCSLTVMGIFKQKSHHLRQFNLLQWSNDAVSAACSSCLCFFGGNPSRKETRAEGGASQEICSRSPSSHRRWTNFILAVNVLVYVAQIATQGKLMLWGAKINSLIDKGQFWRLVTSSLLHANVGHLMVNCYSLNSIGPTVENICGTRRFFTIYFTSAVASSAMSYWLSSAPAVGASGAIFGLVGSAAVFSLRHRSLFGSGKEDLQQIAQVIVLNMVVVFSWFITLNPFND